MSAVLTLDTVRAAFPRIGLAVYAYEPGDAVTLEVYANDGQVFTFRGPTLLDVLVRAFPLLAPSPEADTEIEPEPEPEPEPEQPQPSVFD